jgi:hypothetical protein
MLSPVLSQRSAETLHGGKYSPRWKVQSAVEIQSTVEGTVCSGKYSTRWKVQSTVESTVRGGKYSPRWKVQSKVESTVHGGKYQSKDIRNNSLNGDGDKPGI